MLLRRVCSSNMPVIRAAHDSSWFDSAVCFLLLLICQLAGFLLVISKYHPLPDVFIWVHPKHKALPTDWHGQRLLCWVSYSSILTKPSMAVYGLEPKDAFVRLFRTGRSSKTCQSAGLSIYAVAMKQPSF